MPHKGASTQRHNQQVLVKPRHSPSDRDQKARHKLQQKAKIRSRAYIQLGEDTLKTVHKTFQPGVPVILHLPALTDGSLNLEEPTTPTLFVICMIPVPVIVLYLCCTLVSTLNSTKLHLQGVAPRSQYSDPVLEVVTLQ